MRSTPAVYTSLILSCLVWPSPPPLRAATIGLNANAGFQANSPASGQFVSNSINIPLTMTPIVLSPFSGSSANADAFASGMVTFGSITGETFASASGNGGAAAASFAGAWQDTLLVTSSNLAQGTPVLLRFTLVTSGSLTCAGPSAGVFFSASFLTSLGGGPGAQSGTCNTSLSDDVPFTLSTFVGASIGIEGELAEQATASSVTSPSSADVDPPSAQFFIDPETSGATYVTGSGNNYFTPPSAAITPEPASLALLGTGLSSLATARWLSHKRDRLKGGFSHAADSPGL